MTHLDRKRLPVSVTSASATEGHSDTSDETKKYLAFKIARVFGKNVEEVFCIPRNKTSRAPAGGYSGACRSHIPRSNRSEFRP
jgi:DNA-binding XRE family transcriptional regulator